MEKQTDPEVLDILAKIAAHKERVGPYHLDYSRLVIPSPMTNLARVWHARIIAGNDTFLAVVNCLPLPHQPMPYHWPTSYPGKRFIG